MPSAIRGPNLTVSLHSGGMGITATPLDIPDVMLLEPEVFGYIDGDDTQFEREPLEHLAKDGELMAYKHPGFWQCMDTLREKHILQNLWDGGNAPWKCWD